MKPRRVPEKAVQRQVVNAYRALGCHVLEFSQPRATMQTEGIPDLYVSWPARRATWWHEVKAADGVLRPAQQRIHEQLRAAGDTVVVGGLDAALEQLRAVRAITRGGGILA